MDVLRRSLLVLLLWRVDSTSLKGGLTSTASALPGAKKSSIKTAKPHSTIKLAKGDKRETNSALLRLVRCSEPENMLFARTCYLAAHRHATLARHIRPRKWSTRFWHMLAHKSDQISSLLFASLEIAEALSSTLSKRSGNIAPGNSRHNIVRRIPEGLMLLRNCFQQLRGMHGWECEKRFHSILAQV